MSDVLQRKRTTERVAAEMGSTARVLQAVLVVEGMDWGWGWAAFLVDYEGTRATAATASSLTADCRRQVKPQHQISAKWSSRASNSISGPEARRCYCSS
jgi:hypothetical protein